VAAIVVVAMMMVAAVMMVVAVTVVVVEVVVEVAMDLKGAVEEASMEVIAAMAALLRRAHQILLLISSDALCAEVVEVVEVVPKVVEVVLKVLGGCAEGGGGCGGGYGGGCERIWSFVPSLLRISDAVRTRLSKVLSWTGQICPKS